MRALPTVATRLRGALGAVTGPGVNVPDASSRFGDPAWGSVTTDGVAVASRREAIVAGVAVASALSSRAATPATCGAAIEVPEIVAVAVVEVYQSDVMLEPGAKMSRQVPKLE